MVEDGYHRITYAQHQARVYQFASALTAWGVNHEMQAVAEAMFREGGNPSSAIPETPENGVPAKTKQPERFAQPFLAAGAVREAGEAGGRRGGRQARRVGAVWEAGEAGGRRKLVVHPPPRAPPLETLTQNSSERAGVPAPPASS